jgi:hypothetical protein
MAYPDLRVAACSGESSGSSTAFAMTGPVNYLAALRAFGVTVHESRFTKVERKCRDFGNTCFFHEEKQTDVGIAVKMVSDAMSSAADRMVLLTADSDQIPTAKFIIGLPSIGLTLVYPPNRGAPALDTN